MPRFGARRRRSQLLKLINDAEKNRSLPLLLNASDCSREIAVLDDRRRAVGKPLIKLLHETTHDSEIKESSCSNYQPQNDKTLEEAQSPKDSSLPKIKDEDIFSIRPLSMATPDEKIVSGDNHDQQRTIPDGKDGTIDPRPQEVLTMREIGQSSFIKMDEKCDSSVEFMESHSFSGNMDQELGVISDRIIQLDVGGQSFTTRQSTLCNKSILFRTILHHKNLNRNIVLKNGVYFIDRDPEPFRYLLSFMRIGEIILESNDRVNLERIMMEADFYKIKGIVVRTPSRAPSEFGSIDMSDILRVNPCVLSFDDITAWIPPKFLPCQYIKKGVRLVKTFREGLFDHFGI